MPEVTLHSGRRITGVRAFLLLVVTAPLWMTGLLLDVYRRK
jgi:hypothetical protein